MKKLKKTDDDKLLIKKKKLKKPSYKDNLTGKAISQLHKKMVESKK